MLNNKYSRSLFIIVLMMANIGCDQVSKNIARKQLDYNQDISLLYNRFTLTKVENPGAFLSLGDHLSTGLKNVLLIALPLIILISGLIFLLSKRDIARVPLIALCFVIGGGIGNIYDRLAHGSVTDFMHIDFYIFETGIFNMADVSVTAGMLMIVGYYFFGQKREQVAE